MVRVAVLVFVVIAALARLLAGPTQDLHSGKSSWSVNIPLTR